VACEPHRSTGNAPGVFMGTWRQLCETDALSCELHEAAANMAMFRTTAFRWRELRQLRRQWVDTAPWRTFESCR